MSYRNVMIQDISAELTLLKEQKINWKANFIANSIITKHSDEWNGDSDFLEYNLYENVKRLVTQVISKLVEKMEKYDPLFIMGGLDNKEIEEMKTYISTLEAWCDTFIINID